MIEIKNFWFELRKGMTNYNNFILDDKTLDKLLISLAIFAMIIFFTILYYTF